MKKVIPYIASHFRKDKIWLRRTRPDTRRYQVVVAIDDSRSMAHAGCGAFALEALTLLCSAMARLEVGELGVLRFGGVGGMRVLHPLDRPFTDSDGVRVLSQLTFDLDNTLADQPMVELLTGLDAMLAAARARAGGRGGSHAAQLHQLVLVVADGRFHERDALRRAVRVLADRPGVMLAFLVLDSSTSSLVEMQSVAFGADGKPTFTRYLDGFPFPYYMLLRDVRALPRALAGLMRQWFELQAR